ncbi:MAG TPA: isocitrate lyase/phosphoenolpyruvate mutase family protein [Solirubrobacteraceae bacterium]|nr:isocitrate lyase/phosphoenolpyruvate mutase family protein [Solirubrobacteraceae bacterium]
MRATYRCCCRAPGTWGRQSCWRRSAEALATTSSGFAATLGRVDGSVTRAEALADAAAVVGATGLPVSADLENGFADAPGEVAQTVRAAIDAGLAGCSIEDFTGVRSGGCALTETRAPTSSTRRGLTRIEDIRRVVEAVAPTPVNVLTVPGGLMSASFQQPASSGSRPAGTQLTARARVVTWVARACAVHREQHR